MNIIKFQLINPFYSLSSIFLLGITKNFFFVLILYDDDYDYYVCMGLLLTGVYLFLPNPFFFFHMSFYFLFGLVHFFFFDIYFFLQIDNDEDNNENDESQDIQNSDIASTGLSDARNSVDVANNSATGSADVTTITSNSAQQSVTAASTANSTTNTTNAKVSSSPCDTNPNAHNPSDNAPYLTPKPSKPSSTTTTPNRGTVVIKRLTGGITNVLFQATYYYPPSQDDHPLLQSTTAPATANPTTISSSDILSEVSALTVNNEKEDSFVPTISSGAASSTSSTIISDDESNPHPRHHLDDPQLTQSSTDKSSPSITVLIRAYGKGTDTIIDRDREFATHQHLHSRGLAPQLYARFSNGLVYAYLPGRAIEYTLLSHPDVMVAVARRLAEWHDCLDANEIDAQIASLKKLESQSIDNNNNNNLSLSTSNTTTTTTATTFVTTFWDLLEIWIKAMPEGVIKSYTKSQLQTELQWIKQEIGQGNRGGPMVVAHCDLLAGNVIVPPGWTPREISTINNTKLASSSLLSVSPTLSAAPSTSSSIETLQPLRQDDNNNNNTDKQSTLNNTTTTTNGHYSPNINGNSHDIPNTSTTNNTTTTTNNDDNDHDDDYNDNNKSTQKSRQQKQQQQQQSPLEVSFIDYEYAMNAPRAFDIANHFMEWQGFDCNKSLIPKPEANNPVLRNWARDYLSYFNNKKSSSSSTSSSTTTTTTTNSEKEINLLVQQVLDWWGMPGFYWGIWSSIQSTISDIEFDYANYSNERLAEYWDWKKRYLNNNN